MRAAALGNANSRHLDWLVNPFRSDSSILVAEQRPVENVLATTLNSVAETTAQGIAAEQFDDIVRQHQRRVYRVIFVLVKNADVADTLTQECFLRAYEKRAGFRGESAISTWLLRIAVNLVRDHAKRRRISFWRKLVGFEEEESGTSMETYLASPQASPERALLAREELQAVWGAVDSLSPQQRTIFLLRYAEELSLPEIGEILHLKTGSVKAQLFRATNKVKQTVRGPHAANAPAQ
jgi:RNA polymerase sigma-70 factor (ECF subfamily)